MKDEVGDIARTFNQLRHRSEAFIQVLRREWPYRMHEYAWWNLIDIAEMYLTLQIDDREIIERIGNEVFKLVYAMKYNYVAKALKVIAYLESGDERTYRLLIRAMPRRIWSF